MCKSIYSSFALVIMLAHAGCADDVAGVIGDGCPDNDCGTNSAETTRLPISELHLRAGENTGEISRLNAQVVDFLAPDGATGGPDVRRAPALVRWLRGRLRVAHRGHGHVKRAGFGK